MCANPVKKSSSFRIEDILTNKNMKVDPKIIIYNIDKINNNNIVKTNQITIATESINTKKNNLSGETNKQSLDQPDLLRKTLLNKVDDKSEYKSVNKYFYSHSLSVPEDLSSKASSEIEKRRNSMLGHNERTSAFKGLESSSRRFSGHSDYPMSRYSYPGSASYLDPYRTSFGNGPQSNPWQMHPGSYDFSSSYLHSGYHPYFPYSYHRPYPLPLSLSFPLSNSKRKGGQVRFTPQQTQNLERRFGSHQYLSPEDRRILADQLKLTDRQVKTWFQNRRAKWRRTKNMSSSDSQDACNIQSDEELLSSDSNESSMFRSPRNSPISVG